ncbi:HpcH/HpaI aldolase family protein [Flexivirga alba]|uniref:HpcH/HpaI aldolase/citrate lyase family protein n=1 Tax=Flexivirga alba TaxID=702742 RepID=A0ABW2ADM1_9MICO
MAELNGVARRLERGERVFASFCAPNANAALDLSTTSYDAVLFEAEHKPWDVPELRNAFQYLLNRRTILEAGGPAPAITPLVRIPPNGSERAQWHAKQALDLGAYGIVWPHITSVEEAANAVAACRYPGVDQHGPAGQRGDSPVAAARYWGVPLDEYYRRAGVWSLDDDGEILVVIMIEDRAGIENLDDILEQVPGIGLVLIGEGDLSQELGVPRQFEHPTVLAHKERVLTACAKHGVAVGHPHVTAANAERALADGYRFLMTAPVVTYPGLEVARQLSERDRPNIDVN